MKTLKSLAKRVKFTATGKVLRRRAGMSHNLSCKNRKRKRYLKRPVAVAPAVVRRIRKLIPGS